MKIPWAAAFSMPYMNGLVSHLLVHEPGSEIGLDHIEGSISHIQEESMKLRCIERIPKLQFGCLPHVADFQGTDEVGEVIGRIVYHGFKHGICNGFRIAEVSGQIFLNIFPLPAQVVDGHIQIGVDAECGLGVGLQQFAKQRIQAVVQTVGECLYISGPALGVAGKSLRFF